eukprot:4352501-Karenia_brevis.AAC.1
MRCNRVLQCPASTQSCRHVRRDDSGGVRRLCSMRCNIALKSSAQHLHLTMQEEWTVQHVT